MTGSLPTTRRARSIQRRGPVPEAESASTRTKPRIGRPAWFMGLAAIERDTPAAGNDFVAGHCRQEFLRIVGPYKLASRAIGKAASTVMNASIASAR